MKKIELLAPAGNLEKLKVAIDFGADAVYLGGSKLNLRAFSDNFTLDELKTGINYAHEKGAKVYLTLNVIPHNQDLLGLEEYLLDISKIGIDAIIVSDPGIIMTIKEVLPEMEIHLSTQANNVNWKSAMFWYTQGIKRIILARELSLVEIKEIREKLPADCMLEAFVHGSMCMSYSGRCLLSNYMTGRDSNRGACAQPCRYKYYLMEEKRPGEYFPIAQDNAGTYILNSKDLCMIEHIPELIEAGIDSFKIEGRMKSSFYVAMVIKSYRQAIDEYYASIGDYKFNEELLKDVEKVSHRSYYTGFYFGDKRSQVIESSSYIRNYDIVGIVRTFSNGRYTIEQRNKVFEGDLVEVLRPYKETFQVKLLDLRNEAQEKIESAPNAQMLFNIISDKELLSGDLLIRDK